MTLTPSPIPGLDDVDWDMLRRGDMLGPKLGAKVAAILEAAISPNGDTAAALSADLRKTQIELDAAQAALSAANAEVERLREALATSNRHLDFVARWAWREGAHLTDAERLSVIKYYPPIKAPADPSASAALQAEAKP